MMKTCKRIFPVPDPRDLVSAYFPVRFSHVLPTESERSDFRKNFIRRRGTVKCLAYWLEYKSELALHQGAGNHFQFATSCNSQNTYQMPYLA